ncbi:MAG: hypothetical protein ACI4DP_09190 [Candidatus Ornithomonoglobus sp.]
MLTMNATDVRKNWSQVSESVIRVKPQFIKRTRDYMLLSSMELIEELLSAYTFTAKEYIEDDGSVTLSLNELDIVENAGNEELARLRLGEAILEYALEFYDEFDYWSKAPNRKTHIPFVLKALVMDDAEKIGACIKCQPGKN